MSSIHGRTRLRRRRHEAQPHFTMPETWVAPELTQFRNGCGNDVVCRLSSVGNSENERCDKCDHGRARRAQLTQMNATTSGDQANLQLFPRRNHNRVYLLRYLPRGWLLERK